MGLCFMSPCLKEDPWFQWVFKFLRAVYRIKTANHNQFGKFPFGVLAFVINALKAHSLPNWKVHFLYFQYHILHTRCPLENLKTFYPFQDLSSVCWEETENRTVGCAKKGVNWNMMIRLFIKMICFSLQDRVHDI